MTVKIKYLCRNCGEEIALIPDWPLDYEQWHHVKATDEDTMGRYHMDCGAPFDGYEAEL